MKKVLSLIIAAGLMAALIMSLTACGEKKPEPAPETTEATTENTAETTEAPAEGTTEAPAEGTTEAPAEASAGETIAVAFEDFEAMQTLSKAIQNGEKTGAVVEIEGLSKKVGTKYSIGQTDGTNFVGTNYTFEGEYPADGAHVKFVGTVVGEFPLFTLEAQSVEVVE